MLICFFKPDGPCWKNLLSNPIVHCLSMIKICTSLSPKVLLLTNLFIGQGWGEGGEREGVGEREGKKILTLIVGELVVRGRGGERKGKPLP